MNKDKLTHEEIVTKVMEALESIRPFLNNDGGRPVALQEGSKIAEIYKETAHKMIESLVERNKNLPPTEAVKITTMAGCSPKNK